MIRMDRSTKQMWVKDTKQTCSILPAVLLLLSVCISPSAVALASPIEISGSEAKDNTTSLSSSPSNIACRARI